MKTYRETRNYQDHIREATGVTDPVTLEYVEDIMRHEFFCGDMHTATVEELHHGAHAALEMFHALRLHYADMQAELCAL